MSPVSLLIILVASSQLPVSFTESLNSEKARALAENIVDEVLAFIKTKYTAGSDGKLQLPDFSHHFMGMTLIAEKGTLRDMRTFQKSEEAFVAKIIDNKYKIHFEVELPLAEIEYTDCRVKTALGTKEGSFKGTVHGITVTSVVLVDYNDKPCSLQLSKLYISEFAKIHMSIDMGRFSGIASIIAKYFAKHKKDEIKESIEKALTKIVEANLKKIKCDAVNVPKTSITDNDIPL